MRINKRWRIEPDNQRQNYILIKTVNAKKNPHTPHDVIHGRYPRLDMAYTALIEQDVLASDLGRMRAFISLMKKLERDIMKSLNVNERSRWWLDE